MKKNYRGSWLVGVASAAFGIGFAAPATAQEQQVVATGPQQVEADDEAPRAAETIVVLGGIGYRNRSDEAAPVLEYDTDYFQRFEPLTAGDALKRVPSVAFLSDVLESDGVRLRGLDPAYTQILINGEKVPGAGADSGAFGNGSDGAFFVDRIPAELIERVEIVRASSANRSGDAVAGALNIVLRDAYSLDGGYVRVGATMFDDKRVREILGGVWGGEVGGGRLLLGANVQGRRNPKEKFSWRYDEPGGDLDDYEVQTDTRNGTDYSANASYQIELGSSELSLSGFYVHTDRTETEDSLEYENDLVDFDIDTLALINANDVDITQDSWSLNGAYEFDFLGGETAVKLGYSRFKDDSFEFEEETGYLEDEEDANGDELPPVPFPDGDEFEGAATQLNIEDTEYYAKLEHEIEFGDDLELEFGVHYEKKERDTLLAESDSIELDLDPGQVWPDRADTRPFTGFAAVDGGDTTIEQTRIDPYVMVSGETGALTWEAGLRWETTEVTIEERTGGTSTDNDYNILLPSAHLKWELTEADRISLSASRTVRRPSFSFINPVLIEEQFEDNDFQGVATLEPEKAWGFDAGYERRIGREGVVGVNFFYRQVEDLLEVYNTGDLTESYLEGFDEAVEEAVDDGETPPTLEEYMEDESPLFLYSARNTGDGEVWGIEFDASTPLSFIGLPNTGVFANYSWLDSKVDDEFGERRFNSQSDFIYNVGFIHDLTTLNAAFGVTYRKQGDAYSRVVAEEVTTSYGGVLEAFVEKSVGENFTVRFTASNLTDGSKDEVYEKFANAADQVDRDYDEYEIETESAGPVFTLVGRYSF